MGIFDALLGNGQDRRKWLKENIDQPLSEAARYYLGAGNSTPQIMGLASEINPVTGLERSATASQGMLSPDKNNWERLAFAGDMLSELSGAAIPVAAYKAGAIPMAQAMQEGLLGLSVGGNMAADTADLVAREAMANTKSLLGGDLEFVRGRGLPSNTQGVGAEVTRGIGDNGGPPIRTRAELYSPSLRAAERLNQGKGTYDQMKAMLLKGGAKEDELEWSGMNDAFKGKKVTQAELVNYLKNNDPRLQKYGIEAEGTLGANNFDIDVDDAVNAAMEDQPLVWQEMQSYQDMLLDDINYGDNDYLPVNNLSEENLQEIMEVTGLAEDQIGVYDYVRFDGDDVRFFNNNEEVLADMYGGEDALNEELRMRVREGLENDFNYDPENFVDRFGINPPSSFDPNDTRFPEFFPEGGSNYTENMNQYEDPTGRIKQTQTAGGSHFKDYDEGLMYHTRQADYPTTDGKTARYIGEIQSDAQQNLDEFKSNKSYGNTIASQEANDIQRKIWVIEDIVNRGTRSAFGLLDFDFQLPRLAYESKIYDINKKIKDETSWIGKKAKELNVTELLDSNSYSKEWTPDQEKLFELYNNTSSMKGNARWINNPDAQKIAMQYLTENQVDWVPDNFKTEISDAIESALANKEKLTELTNQKNDILRSSYGTITPDGFQDTGPLMSSQNKWVDSALRNSLMDAVNDDSVDYLTFPYAENAIGKVGGNMSDPKQGTVDFYRRDVQNRLRGLLSKYDKDIKPEMIKLAPTENDFGRFDTMGIRLTPEFRQAVKDKGIPTFMLPLGLGTGGILNYLDENNNEPKRGPRRSLLES